MGKIIKKKEVENAIEIFKNIFVCVAILYVSHLMAQPHIFPSQFNI